VATSYIYSRDACSRIQDYYPEMQLIACLRNPIERAYSQHLHEMRMGHVTGENLDFEKGLNNNPTYISQGLYYTHLAFWFEKFSKRQIMVTIYEDIACDPKTFIKDIYEFLDCNSDFESTVLMKRINPFKVSKSRLLSTIVTNLGTVLRKFGLTSLLQVLRSIGVHDRFYKVSIIHTKELPEIGEFTRERLCNIFKRENEKFSKLIKCSLGIGK